MVGGFFWGELVWIQKSSSLITSLILTPGTYIKNNLIEFCSFGMESRVVHMCLGPVLLQLLRMATGPYSSGDRWVNDRAPR